MKRLLARLPPLLGLLLLFGAVYVVRREFHQLKLSDVSAALAAIPTRSLWVAVGCTVASYGVLTLYDRLASIYAGHTVSYIRTSFASFCAYALSHNLGFAAVSGAAVRYRLYAHWGLTPFQIAKVVAFCSLTFGLGGMVLGGAILFAEPGAVPFFGTWLSRGAIYAVGALLWLVVAAYVALSKFVGRVRLFGHEADLPSWRMAILQVLLATVDVAVTAAIFDVLLPPAPGLSYTRFLAVYVASYSAGLLANLPGGIGVFDTAMLLGLAPYLPPSPVVGAIVVFRLLYYVIPLFLAGGLFAGNEVMLRGHALVRRLRPAETRPLSRWPDSDFVVASIVGAVALCGAVLMMIGVLDPRPDFFWISQPYAAVAANAGQYVPSLLGTALVVLAVALSQRVTLAWHATLPTLLFSAAFTASQGRKLWIPAMMVLAILLMAPFRTAFYRRARLFGGRLQARTAMPLFALSACILALAAFEPHVRAFDKNTWWELVLSPSVPNGLRATVLLAVLLALLAAWNLLRPGQVRFVRWHTEGQRRYAALGALPVGEADGLVLGEQGRAGVPFRRMGQVLLALGDPVGARGDRISAIWRLHDLARQEGRDPAFWRTGPDLLPIYGDLGLTALPLGGDGLPCAAAPVTPLGRAAATGDRYLCCVAERDLTAILPLLPALAGTRRSRTA